jgi:Ca2+-binding RTX toxin-like protein
MRIPLAILTVTGTLALPAVAAAAPSTVSYDSATGTTTFRSGSNPSDLNAVESSDEPAMTYSDAGNPLTVGPGCTAGSPAFCPIGLVEIRLGAEGDHAFVFTNSSTVNVTAGGGDDTIRAAQIRGVTRGGAGDDTIRANSREAQVYGDGGHDSIYAREDSMQVFGGDGNDLLVTEADPGRLEGGDGFDVLIAGRFGAPMDGGDDPDIIGFFPGVAGGAPLNGGGLYDSIHGSEGRDPVSGGAGNDEVWVYGGNVDTVNCGGGFDVVYADADDVVASNCERVLLEPGPADPAFEAALARAEELRGRSASRALLHEEL